VSASHNKQMKKWKEKQTTSFVDTILT